MLGCYQASNVRGEPTGWRGALRSLVAASRQIQRDKHRKQQEFLKRQQQAAKLLAARRTAGEKDTLKRQQQLTKLAIVHRAAAEVEAYNNYINGMTSIHQTCSEGWDWNAVKNTAADNPELEQIAAGVVAGEVSAFKNALEELRPFAEVKELGRGVQMSFNQRYVQATIRLHDQDRVPRYSKTLLKTGTVSTKPAPESSVNETYQKHVCSCVLRAARELFAVLPFQKAFIHATADLLNVRTGNKETQVIVSVLIPRGTLETLNFATLNPVDCMRNFIHRMEFSKSQGFSSVNPLEPREFETPAPPRVIPPPDAPTTPESHEVPRQPRSFQEKIQ